MDKRYLPPFKGRPYTNKEIEKGNSAMEKAKTE
jgi:hypothetical protein